MSSRGAPVRCWVTALQWPPNEATGSRSELSVPGMTVVSNAGDRTHTYTLNHGGSINLQTAEEAHASARSAPLIGAVVWPAAVALSIWLADAAVVGRVQMKGSRLLELGAGMGVPGLLMATLAGEQPERAVLSDFAAPLLENLLQNVTRNRVAFCVACGDEVVSPTDVDVCKLNWDDSDDDCAAVEQYDIVIGADVVYNPAHAGQLLRTVLPRLATAYSTLLLIQPGVCSERQASNTTGDEILGADAVGDDTDSGRAVYSFETRNGWHQTKAAFAREGDIEVLLLNLASTGDSAEGACSAHGAGVSYRNPGGGSDSEGTTQFELLIFHKRVLSLMPPPTLPSPVAATG